jgi:hypothetical protein
MEKYYETKIDAILAQVLIYSIVAAEIPIEGAQRAIHTISERTPQLN